MSVLSLYNFFELVLLSLFIFYFLFILFLLRGIFKIKSFSTPKDLRASVIVPFRNEENFLRRCVLSILNQNLERKKFEIILVDDHSTDNSLASIEDLIDENIKVIKLGNESGKKKAIEAGIQHSKNEIIVTTDADCFHNENWLNSLLQTFDDKTGFVAGKVVYSNTKNLFEEFQKIEFASLVSIGAAFIGNRFPVLANGASCAYRKDLFIEVGGFKDNLSLASGDEEFLMQKIFFETDYEVRFCSSKKSVTFTEPIQSLSDFLNQRKRWVSKVPFYKNKYLLPILIILFFFYFTFLVSLIYNLFYFKLSMTIFAIFVSKNLIDFVFMLRGYTLLELSENKLEIVKLILLFPFAEVLHLFYISFVPILSYFTGFKWKGRKFKK